MEQHDDKPMAYLLELENEIDINSETLTPKYIPQTRNKLHSIVLQLDHIHNSRLGINKLIPDILYTIFELAVYELFSSATILRISQNAPLRLSWTKHWKEFKFALSTPYFVSRANSILPRLYSLTIHAPYTCFAQFHRIIQKNGSPPIQLQYLNIHLFRDRYDHADRQAPPPLKNLIDNSCLQELKLSGLDSHWLDLPHRNLTSLTYCDPINPPAVPQLLVFLFNCPLLKMLELEFRDYAKDEIKTIFTTSTSPSTVNELVLNLTRLKLGALGPSSYEFVRRFSRCIQILPGVLSQFEVRCSPTYFEEFYTAGPPYQDLAVVPPGMFSNFSSCQFLEITLLQYVEECLRIFGRTSVSDTRESSPLLSIICTDFKPVDYSSILEMLQAMPRICHLRLTCRGFQAVLTLWPNLEIRSAFPCLHTLELIGCDIKALPTNLQFKRLILERCVVPSDVLFDMVSRIGIEILEIVDCRDDGTDEYIRVDDFSGLRKMGVDVTVVRDAAS